MLALADLLPLRSLLSEPLRLILRTSLFEADALSLWLFDRLRDIERLWYIDPLADLLADLNRLALADIEAL